MSLEGKKLVFYFERLESTIDLNSEFEFPGEDYRRAMNTALEERRSNFENEKN